MILLLVFQRFEIKSGFPFFTHTVYTERQKKHHFFRVTPTKIHLIKMNHIWTQISYSSLHEAHLINQMVAFVKKEQYAVKLGKLQKVIFQKSQKLLAA